MLRYGGRVGARLAPPQPRWQSESGQKHPEQRAPAPLLRSVLGARLATRTLACSQAPGTELAAGAQDQLLVNDDYEYEMDEIEEEEEFERAFGVALLKS